MGPSSLRQGEGWLGLPDPGQEEAAKHHLPLCGGASLRETLRVQSGLLQRSTARISPAVCCGSRAFPLPQTLFVAASPERLCSSLLQQRQAGSPSLSHPLSWYHNTYHVMQITHNWGGYLV